MIWGQVLGSVRSRPVFVTQEKSTWGMPYWKFWIDIHSMRTKWRGGQSYRGLVTIAYPDRVGKIVPHLRPGERVLLGGEMYPWVLKREDGNEARSAMYIMAAFMCLVDHPTMRGER